MTKKFFHWDVLNDFVTHETDELGVTLVAYTNELRDYGPLLSEYREGAESYHHCDALGSTVLLTDDTGAITDAFLYDAFGILVSRVGSTSTTFEWVGRWGYEFSMATGWLSVRARSYVPEIARWASRDPIGFVDTPNLYQYSASMPTQAIDPSGQWIWVDCWAFYYAVRSIVSGHTAASWYNFATAGTARQDPVILSQSDMKEVYDQYDLFNRRIKPLSIECANKCSPGWRNRNSSAGFNGTGSSSGVTSGYYYYNYNDPSWQAALGGVYFKIYSTCKCSSTPGQYQLTYKITVHDEWDFDNLRKGWSQVPRNIIVLMVKVPNVALNCGYKNFWHDGKLCGITRGPCPSAARVTPAQSFVGCDGNELSGFDVP